MFMPRSEARSGTAGRRRLVRETFVNVSVLRDFPSSLHFRLMSCKIKQKTHHTGDATVGCADVIPPASARRYLSLVRVDQRRGGGHHGAAAWSRQRRDQRLGDPFGPLFQDLPQTLQVVHQGPVDAFLGPVRLQQAAQHRHVKVGGVACPLGQGGGQTGRGGRPSWNRDTDMDVGTSLTFSHDRKTTTFPV